MSDTPRTDAAYKNHAWDMHDHIPVEFCRQLERELHETQEANIRMGRKLAQVLDERDALVEALEKISNEDYRGNRPWSATVAYHALSAMKGEKP